MNNNNVNATLWPLRRESIPAADSDGHLPDLRLEDSHRRCQAAGLSPGLGKLTQQLGSAQLTSFLGRHAALCAYCHLLFSDIYNDLRDRKYVIILADDTPRLITLHSSTEILNNATGELGMRAGVSLKEEDCGTNAVALALRFRQLMTVRGEQHYCRLFHSCFAVAVPVLDARREPQACVAMFSCHDAIPAEKIALMKFIAKDIENFSRGASDGNHVNGSGESPQRAADISGLTARQLQVLALFAKGMSYKQIARRLGIRSVKTVEEHLDAVRSKLHAGRRRECIQKAMALGLLEN